MIRPITVFCSILALCAGLYLYRAKHEVELMDKHIDLIAKQTSDLRAESRRLLDDWIRLGEPEQLHKYSDEYLGLKTIAPTQFARLSDLATRLQPPRADPPDEPPEAVAQSPDGQPAGTSPPVAETAAQPVQSGSTDIDGVSEVAEDLPVPPIPPAIGATGILQASTTQTVPSQAGAPQTVVIAPPLQARPVTPRLTAGPAEPDAQRLRAADPLRNSDATRVGELARTGDVARTGEAARAGDPLRAADQTRVAEPLRSPDPQRTGELPRASDLPRVADETRTPVSRPSQVTMAGARPVSGNVPLANVSSNLPAPAQPAWRASGLPPLQAQATAQGLPPQTQMPVAVQPRVQAAVQMLPPPQMTPRWRPAGPANAPSQSPPPRTYQAQSPAPGGSLLGTSRGAVPLPLPAPTPVSATWSGANATGPGRPARPGQ